MKIELLVFGIFTDIFKANQVEFDLPNLLNVGDLKKIIISKYPQTQALNFTIAVDEAYADDEQIIKNNQTIALIPPASGG